MVSQGWFKRLRGQMKADTLAGLIGGGLAAFVSFAGRRLVSWGEVGDPLPLVLTLQQLLRGNFLYIAWSWIVGPLLFMTALALLVTVLLAFLNEEDGWTTAEAGRAAQVASAVNVAAIALVRVDAFIVGVWYVLSGLVAVALTGFFAGRLARLFHAFGRSDHI